MARAHQTVPASRKTTQAKAGAGKGTRTGATLNRTNATNTNRNQGQTATNRTAMKKQAARTSTSATPASVRTAPAKKQTAAVTQAKAGAGGKRNQTKTQREAASSPVSRTGQALIPIRARQSRSQIIATVAADTGVEAPIVDRVARSLSTTLTRHLVPNGSGRVEIPYMNAALYVGRQAAMKARTMMSPILGRNVQIPARKSKPVARFRPHSVLRELVARS